MSDGDLTVGASARFVPNVAGMRQLMGREETQKALAAIGSRLADTAKGNGGRFSRRSWFTETRVEGSQAIVRVGTDQPAAHWDEWGTIYRAPRAPLRRALQELRLWPKTKASPKA